MQSGMQDSVMCWLQLPGAVEPVQCQLADLQLTVPQLAELQLADLLHLLLCQGYLGSQTAATRRAKCLAEGKVQALKPRAPSQLVCVLLLYQQYPKQQYASE